MLLAVRIPNCVSYDPAFAYELAVIIQDGIRRMYEEQESIFYYLTVMNEQYADAGDARGRARRHPQGDVPAAARADNGKAKLKAQLLGSGAILNEVLAAQKMLEKYGVAADVWSVTSYQELYRDGACLRSLEHAASRPRRRRVPYVTQCLENAPGVFVAASDYLKVLPDSIDRGCRAGCARSAPTASAAARIAASLREFFEVDARFVALATLAELAQDGQLDRKVVAQAIKDLGIDPEKKRAGESMRRATCQVPRSNVLRRATCQVPVPTCEFDVRRWDLDWNRQLECNW